MSALLLVLILLIYFAPTGVAFKRQVEPVVAITLLNVFLGWTVLGWLILLIWAYQANRKGSD